MARVRRWFPMVVAAALLTSCVGGQAARPPQDDAAAAPADKAGGSGGAVVLAMGAEGRPGRPDADQVLHFADEVAQRSDGRIRIEPVWGAPGEEHDADPADYPGWDQLVARALVAGELDLAIVPARAWDTEGVTSLRALTAPLLVTSEELVAAVVAGPLADELLAGLEDVGVVGLGLPPEGMRRLFAFGDPPTSAMPWSGGIVRAPRSATTYAFLTALGGEPDDLPGGGTDRFAEGVRDGTIVAAESGFRFVGGIPEPHAAVGGPPLFPKVNALVVNADTYGSLTEADQQLLQEAATATVAWAIQTMPTESEEAGDHCERGGRILPGIPTGDLDAAAAEVEDDLREDPVTAALLDDIRGLAADLGAAPTAIEPCTPDDADSNGDDPSDDPTSVDDEGVFPEGAYRVEHTTEELVAAGVDRPTAADHAGMWTMRFADGQLRIEQERATTGEVLVDVGVYCVEDGRVVLGIDMFSDPPTCGTFWSGAWELAGDELTFVDVTSHHGYQDLIEALFGRQPWQRIG
jgi:TRAP-type transport system periplasmic protein